MGNGFLAHFVIALWDPVTTATNPNGLWSFLGTTNPPVVKKGFYFYIAAFVILTSIYNHAWTVYVVLSLAAKGGRFQIDSL